MLIKTETFLRKCGDIRTEECGGLCEPVLTEMSDGTLVCLMRCNFVRELFISYCEVGWLCCYPDGFIDEERGVICFGWDDRHNIYYSEYKLPDSLI